MSETHIANFLKGKGLDDKSELTFYGACQAIRDYREAERSRIKKAVEKYKMMHCSTCHAQYKCTCFPLDEILKIIDNADI